MTRGEIAEAVGLHPATLSRLVLRKTGMGIRQYLNGIRLAHARALLETRTLSIKEVARQCGFRYHGYFLRVFKNRYGKSPGNYRTGLYRGSLPDRLDNGEDMEFREDKQTGMFAADKEG